MPNRLFYTMKLTSSFIIERQCDIKNFSFVDALMKNQIISLADSQMLRSIREITHHEVNLDLLEKWYSERDRIKRRKNSEENKALIRKYQNNIYKMMYIPEYVTVVIEKNIHYQRFFKKGFYINGEKYSRFSCSASQARVSTVVFIKDNIKQEMLDKLNNGGMIFDENGLSETKFAPSKYNAYFGLYSSATKKVTTPRFCIIPDFLETDKVDVDFVIETGPNDDDIVEARTIDVEFNRFDGNGLISPQYAEIWSKDIGIYTPEDETNQGYIACQFCMRWSFAKGMLNTFDFLKFCEEKNNGNYIIKDIYGKDVDLRNIDVILTEGQTKIWDKFGYTIIDKNNETKFIPDQNVYEENSKKNGIIWGVTRYTPEEDDKTLITNYQFLQTLKMSDEDVRELCKDTVDYLKGVSYDNYYYTLLFMLGKAMTEEKMQNYMKSSDNYWLKSLICNPNLLNDKYSKEKIRDCLVKRIEQACIGKIMVEGNFQVIIPDSYAFMEWTCFRDANRVKGLLDAGECYSKFWTDRDKTTILTQRPPLTHFSECHLMKVKNNEEIQKWFKYSYTGFYTNTHDNSVMCWAGSDFDYDIISSTSNPVMIRSVRKGYKPVTYDIPKPFKKQFTEEDMFKADCQTFGSLIGPLTNNGTSIIALISEYEEICKENPTEENKKKLKLLLDRLKMVCSSQSKQIDKAKIGKEVKGIPSIWVTYNHIEADDDQQTIEEKQFYNSILCDRRPYFFKYLYKTTRKEYNDFYKKVEEKCNFLFRMSLKELRKKEDKTEEQKEFLAVAEKNTRLINSDCEMNKICKHIESIDFEIKRKIHSNEDFDYHLLMSKNFIIDNLILEKIKTKISQLHKTLSANQKEIEKNASKSNMFFTEDRYDTYNIFCKFIEDELLSECCSNVEELTNYMILIFYEYKKTWNKNLLWKTFGKQIYENCLNNCERKIKVPVKNSNGEIKFWNDKFTVENMYILNEEDDENDKNI